MTAVFEAVMLTAFSSGWYFSIFKMLRTGKASGKSVVFVMVISFGYACGVASKLTEYAETGVLPLLVWFYLWCMFVTALDAALVVHFSRREGGEGRPGPPRGALPVTVVPGRGPTGP